MKIKRIIIVAVSMFIVFGTISSVLLFNKNLDKIYPNPPIINAVCDYEGYACEEEKAPRYFTGKWEFYYNKFIETDNLDCEPDCYIELPSKWTGMEINGKRISNRGYASYKITLVNVRENARIVYEYLGTKTPYRVYANGELWVSNGTISKNLSETKNDYYYETYFELYAPSDGKIELVVEVSNNIYGGIDRTIGINFGKLNPTSGNAIAILFFIAVGMIISCMVVAISIEILSYKYKKNFAYLLFIFAFLIHCVLSVEIYSTIIWRLQRPANYTFFSYGSSITGFILFILLINSLVGEKMIKLSKAKTLFLIISILALALAYVLLAPTNYRYIPVLLICIGSVPIIYENIKSINLLTVLFDILYVLVLSLFGCEMLQDSSTISFGLEGVLSVYVLGIMVVVIMISIAKIAKVFADKRKKEQLEMVNIKLKQETLKAQIKPHFIFNSLTAIQNLYHKDISQGDKAMEKFSRHLRANVDSDKKEIVSFNEELDNILNYFELENIRKNGNLNLVFDINYDDFLIPILSLQPFVENAVKYAKTEEKEEGYIQISSNVINNFIIIEINDNGVGFDINNIRPEATGLKNCIERLKLLLQAKVEIESEINVGTSIKIYIPRGEDNEQ